MAVNIRLIRNKGVKERMKKVKRPLSILLIMTMIMTMLPTMAFADVDGKFTVDNFKYEVLTEDVGAGTGTVALVGYASDPSGNLTVAEEVYSDDTGISYTVIEIGEEAFKDYEDITGVEIPDSVNNIGKKAFSNCGNLNSATFLGDVPETISADIFQSCTSLTHIYVPEGQVEEYKNKLADNQDIIQPIGTYDYEIDLGKINKNANGVDDGYTVGNYGEGPLIYLKQANKTYRVTGETDYYGLIIDGEGISLTLDGVNIDMDDWNNALNLSTDLTLNLEGKNVLSGTGSAIGIYTGEWDLTIQGTGSLETDSALLISEIKDFTLKSGRIHGRLVADNIRIEGGTVNAVATDWNSSAIGAESSVTISGGTLDIQSESGYGIYAYYNSGTITITGGSLNVSGGEGFGPTNIAPTDGYSTVYKTKLGGLPANTLITDLTAPDGYGYTDMYTDDGGWLYLWLPEGEQTVAFNAGTTVVDKTFTIAANNDNIFAAVDMNIDVDSGADLKVALESLLPSNINVTGDFDCSLQIKLGGNHTLTIPAGKTVAITDNGFIDLRSNTLNIKGGGELVLQSGYSYNFYGDEGKLDLEDITVTSRARGTGAIKVKTVVVGDGATIVSDGESAHYLLRIEEGHTCTVKLGGTIDTGSFSDYGISIADGVLHIDEGTVKLSQGGGANNAIFMGSGTLKKTSDSIDADGDAVINLPNQGISIQGFANSFKDRGVEFTAEEAIVGERDGLPSADGLTAGSYHWDGSFFSKEAIAITAQPQSMEFHQGEITGSLTVSAEASNDNPIGYQWCTIDGYGSYDGIDGANSDTFPIPTDLTPGTYYYVCWLNADKCDSVSSNIATVTIIGELPAVPYTLTIDGSYAPTPGGGIYMEGDTVCIKAGSRSGYSFAGWTSSDNISFADKNSTTTTFIMPGKFIRVTANWSAEKEKDKDKDKKDKGKGTTTPAPLTPTTPTAPAKTTITTAAAVVSSGGIAKAEVTAEQMTDTIAKAKETSANTGEKPNIEIKLQGTAEAKTVEAKLPAKAIKEMASGDIGTTTIASDIGSITFDEKALKAISNEAEEEVSISIAKADTTALPKEVKNKIGDRPVYDFSVKSGGKTISKFGSEVKITIPYTPAKDEDINAIVVYYVNDNGELETITNCRYDASTGNIIFETNHFSYYAIGYNKIEYKDVADNAWYSAPVSFISSRGITSGTSENTFGPNNTLTRGQFITLLLKAYNIAPKDKKADNFHDAGDTYYTGYLAAAKEMGVTKGKGNNKFAPNEAITRQEMFTLLYNVLEKVNKLPKGSSGQTTVNYIDKDKIADYAIKPMEYLIKAGAIKGDNGKLNPTTTTTRAQLAQVLYNLMK